ncbi:MAG: CocE/NonD family hydrolase, partial [Actinomycetota bacterium]|nr:CocE/NonD family hydrolase [Actinomycetota bacterium]
MSGGRLTGAASALAVLCLALAAAPAPAAEVETLPFEAQAADGTALRGHVFLPKQAPRPLATVLQYSPYFGHPDGQTTEEWGTSEEVAFLLDAGFALAAVNMRGTGRSEDCMRYGDEVDWHDAASVVQALAAQPWSNGKVGMYGHSYPAWTQFMAAAVRPPALKAVVPTSGVTDLWSLLARRGAPLTGGLGTGFSTAFTFLAGHQPPEALGQACAHMAQSWRENWQLSVDGDRTPWFEARDLRDELARTPVPIMTTIGIISGVNDGHILQLDDVWGTLHADRTRFVLGQWSHETPRSHKEGWEKQVLGWYDHYLRDGPLTVPGGVVEYQDYSDAWHAADRWPPPSRAQTVHLSSDEVVPEGEPVEEVDATFQSADNDPGLKTDEPDEKTRLYNSTCGPHQVLFASRPLARDALLAGHFEVDLELSSTLPGGNLSVFLWRTKGDGTCPDQSATWFGRALMDLRHFEQAGRSRDFPTMTPTRVRFRSHPLAAVLRKDERFVVAIGGGSSELEPDARHPAITVTGGSLKLPVAGPAPDGDSAGTPPARDGAAAIPPLRFT